MTALAAVREPERRWRPLIDPSCYDRAAALTEDERQALAVLAERSVPVAVRRRGRAGAADRPGRRRAGCDRVPPGAGGAAQSTRSLLVRGAGDHGLAFWGWDRDQWVHTLRGANNNYRQAVAAVGYLLCDQRDLHHAFRGWKLRPAHRSRVRHRGG